MSMFNLFKMVCALPFMTVLSYKFVISRENLKLMRELSDTAAQGRACGNLGNTYYLLGDFQQAIRYHEEVRVILLLF